MAADRDRGFSGPAPKKGGVVLRSPRHPMFLPALLVMPLHPQVVPSSPFLLPSFLSSSLPSFLHSLKAPHHCGLSHWRTFNLPRELARTSEVTQGQTPSKLEGITTQTKLHATPQPAPPFHLAHPPPPFGSSAKLTCSAGTLSTSPTVAPHTPFHTRAHPSIALRFERSSRLAKDPASRCAHLVWHTWVGGGPCSVWSRPARPWWWAPPRGSRSLPAAAPPTPTCCRSHRPPCRASPPPGRGTVRSRRPPSVQSPAGPPGSCQWHSHGLC